MRAKRAFAVVLAGLALVGCARPAQPTVTGSGSTSASATSEPTTAQEPTGVPLAEISIGFEKVAEGFTQPLYVTAAGDGSGRLFVVEKGGRVWIVRDGQKSPKPFLDISGQVSTQSERGLLGLAFSQSFAEDHMFFIDYTDKNGDTTVSRMFATGDAADAASEQVVLKIKQPYANHNGGMIVFGPDGDLYIGTGDGGSGGDPHGNGQNTSVLLGKLLRIDVTRDNSATRDTEYGIPQDNPLANTPKAAREIWAYGLRNPWRFSFDRKTGDLWIGDVGQDAWEEIDFQPAGSPGGQNYGWNVYEGTHPYPPGAAAVTGDFVMPVVEYPHPTGESITGGYVYRGRDQSALWGTYFYGDYVTGRVWGIQQTTAGFKTRELAKTKYNVVSFGEDDSGELYLVDYKGVVYRVIAK